MDIQFIKQAIQNIESEIQEKNRFLEAYRLIEKDIQGRQSSKEPPKEITPSAPVPRIRPRTPKGIIRNICSEMTEPFSIDEIDEELQKRGISNIKRATISFVLSQMKSDGEIDVAKEGSGRIASIFHPPSKT